MGIARDKTPESRNKKCGADPHAPLSRPAEPISPPQIEAAGFLPMETSGTI